MQYIDLTEIYCYKEKKIQNIINVYLFIYKITSCTEPSISSIKLTLIINQHTHFIHLFLEFMF